MPYYFPKKVALRGSVKYLFPSLMTRTTTDVVEIWDYVSLDIRQMLLNKKGIYITGLGTFGVTRQELRVGKDERLTIDRPAFQLSETLRKLNGLGSVKQSIADFVPVVPLEYSRLAEETENLLRIFNDCIKETLLFLSRCMSQGLNIDFSFLNMGVLSIRGKKVKMRFYEEFAFSVDVTGNLKEVLTSGRGKVNWVIPQEAPHIPVILPEADILFPSLQFMTERGELLIKSLQKVTQEEEEEEEEGELYFQEKSDRRDVLPALMHDAPARRRAVNLKEGLQEEKNRREPSVGKLPVIQRSSREKEKSKKMLKAKTEPLAPEFYMKAIEEAAKISAEWDLRNSHLAPAQRKEKKVLADLTAYKVQGAKSFIHGAQLTSLAERLQGKKERELNLRAKKAALQKMKVLQESSKTEPIPNQLSAARLGEVPAHTLLEQSATNALPSRLSGKKEKSCGRQLEEKHQRNTCLAYNLTQLAHKTGTRVFFPHPPSKGKTDKTLEKSLKDCLLIQGMQVSTPLGCRQDKRKESIKEVWICDEIQQITNQEEH